ncbi:MAG: hypothetical protein ACTH2Y_08970 [Corynebacterium sp.]|uniref:hypothetical protein n=1 Tax=unclassified Corynebacterium TaxID=2624378 RepID=UPI002652F189|nr:hypothetical protein [Corynebacterium sp.]MDN6258940.1 hypothetical protein [Corynebacterium sp.]MDN6324292.1 hypothetical protein [Corynebacterium sp.]MDN6386701.1 hypothetical protein [Corynebacterium sp.]MDN6509095.1 hypothetical protein [Corynebacterium sp.]
MEIRYSALRHDSGDVVAPSAGGDMFWELSPTVTSPDSAFDKQMWIQSVLYRWGTCGYTAFVGTGDEGSGERPAATAFFAPPPNFPGSAAMPSGPVSGDAIQISTVFVEPPYMGLYLEHSLIDTILTEAERRGVAAVEAYGRNDEDGAPSGYFPEGYHGWEDRPDGPDADLEAAPVLSADILEQQGFTIVGKHPRFPRYRKKLAEGSSLFSNYATDAHELMNDRGPLSTVLGGQKA